MKKILLPFFCTLITSMSLAQKSLDTKIIVTVSDTAGLYEKVRLNFVNAEFIVKDTRNPDTLVTYPRDTKPIGYVTAIAAIKGNTVTFWGFVGQRNMNILGYTTAPKDFEKIYYYKSGKGWKALSNVAKVLGGQITYSK